MDLSCSLVSAQCFSKSGFDVAFACALEFEFFNADKLTQCIGTPHQFAGETIPHPCSLSCGG